MRTSPLRARRVRVARSILRRSRTRQFSLGAALLGALLVALAGCQSLAWPHLFGNGPAEVQQRQAHQFDPYPDGDLGGGDTTGTRPLGYLNPPPEPQKARWNTQSNLRGVGVR